MPTLTLEQIHTQGLRALVDELGSVGAVCFLQLTEAGLGDYSRERHQRIGKQSVLSLVKQSKRGENGLPLDFVILLTILPLPAAEPQGLAPYLDVS